MADVDEAMGLEIGFDVVVFIVVLPAADLVAATVVMLFDCGCGGNNEREELTPEGGGIVVERLVFCCAGPSLNANTQIFEKNEGIILSPMFVRARRGRDCLLRG